MTRKTQSLTLFLPNPYNHWFDREVRVTAVPLMPLKLANTLSGKVEEFHPLDSATVRMYSCGPTVYDYQHIGNFRTFVFVDLLRRVLLQSGYKLKHVMNITDVDDKIIRNALKEGLSVRDYASRFEKVFLEDMNTLNLQPPEYMVKATDYIPQMATFID